MLEQEVIAAIAAAKKIPPERISLDSTFEELGVDSLDSLTMLFALEERFDIEVPEDDLEGAPVFERNKARISASGTGRLSR